MKKLLLLLATACMATGAMTMKALAQGSAFSYQGQLENNGAPANGGYDIVFSLYATNTGGVVIAGPVTNNATEVSNGLFTTTIDFGETFNGNGYWLNISVSPAGSNTFTDLTPRQPILPTPYAMMATSASNLLGTLPASQVTGPIAMTQLSSAILTNAETGVTLSGTFSGNGAGLTGLNPANLTGTIPLAQLPRAIVTNTEAGVILSGAFSGTFNGSVSGLTNLPVSSISTNGSSAGQVLTSNGGATTWANANPWLGNVPTLATNSNFVSNAVLMGRDRGFFLGFITSANTQQAYTNYITINLSQAVSTNPVVATFSPGASGTWTNTTLNIKGFNVLNQPFQFLTTSNSIIVQSVTAPTTSTSYGMFVHVDQY